MARLSWLSRLDGPLVMTRSVIRYGLYFAVWFLLSVPVWAGLFFSLLFWERDHVRCARAQKCTSPRHLRNGDRRWAVRADCWSGPAIARGISVISHRYSIEAAWKQRSGIFGSCLASAPSSARSHWWSTGSHRKLAASTLDGVFKSALTDAQRAMNWVPAGEWSDASHYDHAHCRRLPQLDGARRLYGRFQPVWLNGVAVPLS